MSKSNSKAASPAPTKKRSVVRYEALSPELMDLFTERYPKGYADFMSYVLKVDKPDGTFFYAVPLETDDAKYLVKVDVTVDDYEDAERGIFGSDDDDDDGGEPGELPDDEPAPGFIEEEAEDDEDE